MVSKKLDSHNLSTSLTMLIIRSRGQWGFGVLDIGLAGVAGAAVEDEGAA